MSDRVGKLSVQGCPQSLLYLHLQGTKPSNYSWQFIYHYDYTNTKMWQNIWVLVYLEKVLVKILTDQNICTLKELKWIVHLWSACSSIYYWWLHITECKVNLITSITAGIIQISAFQINIYLKKVPHIFLLNCTVKLQVSLSLFIWKDVGLSLSLYIKTLPKLFLKVFLPSNKYQFPFRLHLSAKAPFQSVIRICKSVLSMPSKWYLCFYLFHSLVCEVSYSPQTLTSNRLSFRKFFKFQVVKPLDVKTKFYTAEVSLQFLIYL